MYYTQRTLMWYADCTGPACEASGQEGTFPHGRITMVTGYIPADPLLSDQTVLRVSKMMSDLPTLFHQWAQYRLERFGKQALLISQVSLCL